MATVPVNPADLGAAIIDPKDLGGGAPAPARAPAAPKVSPALPRFHSTAMESGLKPPIATDPRAMTGDVARAGAAGNTLNNVFGTVFANPHNAVLSAVTGHGLTVPKTQTDVDEMEQQFYKQTGMNHPLSQGAADALIDPWSYLGVGLPGKFFQGKSLAGKALDVAEEHGFPAAVKAADRLAPMATKVSPRIPAAVASTHNLMGVDSEAKRILARVYGSKWKDEYANRWAARNRSVSEQNEIARRLDAELTTALHGVKPQERGAVFGALQASMKEKSFAPLDALPPHLRAAATRYRTVTDAAALMQGDEDVRKLIGARSTLPESLQPFQSTKPRGLQDRTSFIEHGYTASAPHNAEQELNDAMHAFGGGGTSDSLSTHNPNLQPRKGEALTDPAAIITAQKRANRNTGRSVSAFDAGQRLHGTGQNDLASQLMFRKTYGDDNATAGLLKNITDWDKAGIFVTPSRHMMNVTALGAIADPGATLKTIGQTGLGAAKKIIGRGESQEARYARQAPAINAGAVTADTGAKRSILWDQLGRIPGVGKAIKAPYNVSSGALWNYENELAHNIWKGKVASGMSEDRAALETREELVDYGNRSPLAQKMASVIPFSSWRTKAPLAVARLAARNPGRVSAASRALPAMFGGTQQGPYGPSTTSLPFAEAAQGIGDPIGYARGSLGLAARAAGNLGLNALDVRRFGKAKPEVAAQSRDWFTYGIPTHKYAAQTLPLVGTGLDVTGNGLFDTTERRRPIPQALFESQTGIRQAFPKRPQSRTAQMKQLLLDRGIPPWQVDHYLNALRPR